MIYLASPYSHEQCHVRHERWKQACYAAAWLMKEGKTVFSPIAHSHPIVEIGNLGLEFNSIDYWQKLDCFLISVSGCFMVLTIDGWDRSKGMEVELEAARRGGIPIRYLHVVKENEIYKITHYKIKNTEK